ncbi:type II toxin-antitoxin system HicA family toxin [Trichocoleus sp. FACHB-46]|uniref:Type II toxin-antitoxin system HicA family toxin n=1 Tax=Trichocoleus desertorum GB2-A4 TaxID=2933944 RepID=A0ABV0JH27_9CYAN|nr:type II toxin-antitoxin system HicA family toxin [Trichocoleus sp. FACHB-46]MBD1862369.1 type II toxin-antitoxin system HicA family toxin [Trichocoleus sp. FACHB-46]
MKVREVIKHLVVKGWYHVATKGSHRQFKHPHLPGKVTVSGKLSDDVPIGTLHSILLQSSIERWSRERDATLLNQNLGEKRKGQRANK